MPKKPGDNSEKMEQRVQFVLDLIVELGLSPKTNRSKIVDMLLKREPEITQRTGYRAIKEAENVLKGLGSQSSLEERGLLWERSQYIYKKAQRAENPDLNLLNKITRTQVEIYKLNPAIIMKGNINAQSELSENRSISSELQKAIERQHLFKPSEDEAT